MPPTVDSLTTRAAVLLSTRRGLPLLAGAAALAALRLFAAPQSVWHRDEVVAVEAIRRFDLSSGDAAASPLFVLLGRAGALVSGDPFSGAALVNGAAVLLTFFGLALLFDLLLRDRLAAVLGAAFFVFAPAFLVHSALALPDAAALLFLVLAALAVQGGSPRSAVAAGIFAAAAVACRAPYAFAAVALVAGSAFVETRRSRRALLLGVFGAASLAWALPLAAAGRRPWPAGAGEIGEGMLAIARNAFVDPWGPPVIAVPMIALALAGIAPALRSGGGRLLPLAAVAASQIVVAFAAQPASVVREALPTLLLASLLAASAVLAIARRLSFRAAFPVVAAGFILASGWYLWEMIGAWRTTPSPPVEAARFAAEHVSRPSVVLHDERLAVHAAAMLAEFDPLPVDLGLRRYFADGAVDLWLFTDGVSRHPRASRFAWTPTDAHRRLLAGAPRAVSLRPLDREERYFPGSGVFSEERNEAGLTWRWLGKRASLVVPQTGKGSVTLVLRLPDDAPFASNEVEIAAGGRAQPVTVARGGTALATVAVDGGRTTIAIRSARTLRSGGREVAVQLLWVEWRDAAVGDVQEGDEQRPLVIGGRN
jgi:hypothetical protein